MNRFIVKFTQCLEKNAVSCSLQEVFADFVEMAAIRTSNSVDSSHFKKRELRYCCLLEKYDEKQRQIFLEALAFLVKALNQEAVAGTPTDLLGPVAAKMQIAVHEPCSGTEAMAFGGSASKKDGHDCGQPMFVKVTDLATLYMCYLQLSLYGIPAIVIGDSATPKEWSRWYTPSYILGGWLWRKENGTTKKDTQVPKDEQIYEQLDLLA
ncbi:MAG: hypothetical protein RR415_06100 [Ruthenibacterium sp.]